METKLRSIHSIEFLIEMARLLACIASALAFSASASAQQFDPSMNYFPASAQFTPINAKTFSVSYEQSYKKVNITSGGQTTILALRMIGAPRPTNVELLGTDGATASRIVHLEVPLTRAAFLSTTHIPWIEILGERSTVKAIYGAELVNSPCIRSSIADSSIVDVKLADWSTDVPSLTSTAATAPRPQAVFCTAGWGCPGTTLDIPVHDNAENSVLAVSEYAGFFSLFYNMEAAATHVVHEIASRYACQKQAVATALSTTTTTGTTTTRPKVLWAYVYEGTWTVGSCPNYYCELIQDAGGDMITTSAVGTGAYGGYTLAEFTPLLQGADVWLFAGDTWDSDIVPALALLDTQTFSTVVGTSSDSAIVALAQALSTSTAVKTRRVFDLRRAGTNAWFETRIAQPDAVLQDIASIVTPSATLVGSSASHTRIWFRNVFSENVGNLAPTTTCIDPATQPFVLQGHMCPGTSGLSGDSSNGNSASSGSSGSNGASSTMTAGAIAGAAVGGVAGIALVAAFAVYVAKSVAVMTASTAAAASASASASASGVTSGALASKDGSTIVIRNVLLASGV